MEELQTYLESSTIHGLSYIGSSKSKLSQIFWICVVFCGFLIAGILIHNSFSSWEESPFISTSTTLPISSASFPIVTVCPPRGTNTVLNPDMDALKNISITSRSELIESLHLFANLEYHEDFIKHVNFFTSIEHIIAFYEGTAKFTLPNLNPIQSGYVYEFETALKFGQISTPWFGQKYSREHFTKYARYKYIIMTRAAQTIDIHLTIDLKEGDERVTIIYGPPSGGGPADSYKKSGNYSIMGVTFNSVTISFSRLMDNDAIDVWSNKRMTGLRFEWTINGEVSEDIKFSNGGFKEWMDLYFSLTYDAGLDTDELMANIISEKRGKEESGSTTHQTQDRSFMENLYHALHSKLPNRSIQTSSTDMRPSSPNSIQSQATSKSTKPVSKQTPTTASSSFSSSEKSSKRAEQTTTADQVRQKRSARTNEMFQKAYNFFLFAL